MGSFLFFLQSDLQHVAFLFHDVHLRHVHVILDLEARVHRLELFLVPLNLFGVVTFDLLLLVVDFCREGLGNLIYLSIVLLDFFLKLAVVGFLYLQFVFGIVEIIL